MCARGVGGLLGARALAVGLVLGLVLSAVGCREAPPAPDAQWPDGALLVGERPALAALAARAASLDGTPLADAARELTARLPECAVLEARVPSGDPSALPEALRCHEPGGELAVVEAARAAGASQLLFALPVEGAGRAIGHLRVDGTHLALDLTWTPGDSAGALDLLLPGEAPAGPTRLGASGALVHVRVRPERGIDFQRLIPAESQAQQLFQLRAALFTSAILDGAWEAAIYLPPEDAAMPLAAVAFDVRSRGTALAAANAFAAEVGQKWSVEPRPFSLGEDASGACLSDLRLIPELAPCYVATESALVVGWNAASLVHALGEKPAPATQDPGHLELDFTLFARADALLARHLAPEDRPDTQRWPWQRGVARARREGEGPLRVRIELEGALDT